VVLSDDLCLNGEGAGVLTQMAALYEEFRCSIVAVQTVSPAEISAYGAVAGPTEREGLIRVSQMVEKPTAEQAPSNVAVIGRYILTPDIFDILRDVAPDDGGEIQLTDALKVQASEGRVLAYEFEGIRFDCGQVPGFVEATQYVFEHHYGQH
jgi:UTP--glucose-1-phosphate uridylyltransferase